MVSVCFSCINLLIYVEKLVHVYNTNEWHCGGSWECISTMLALSESLGDISGSVEYLTVLRWVALNLRKWSTYSD